MTVMVPELVSEAPLRMQRAVCFSCWKIFEVKQSSVKKERVFHTQECKMLHNSAEILILCIRISKFYNFYSNFCSPIRAFCQSLYCQLDSHDIYIFVL